MGRYIFRLPDIGEGIAEAEIVAWHVKLGDRIEEDAPLADMMTDKATVEMESPVAGTVVELAGEAGDRIPIGSPLVVLEVEGAVEPAAAPGDRSADETGDGRAASHVASEPPAPERRRPPPARPVPSQAASAQVGPETGEGGKVLASPAVRARAAGLGVDLAAVPSAGARVTHADLDAFLAARVPAERSAPEPSVKTELARLPGAGEQIRVIGLRRRIAENMAASKRHIPHFSYVEECDVTALEDLRAELNGLRGERPRLTLLPLFITAICRALPDYPMINAHFDDAAGVVTRYASVHLGIATQTDAGLMVPVIRDAQALDLWALAGAIARLAASARDGSAKAEDLSGSTLTVTSLGALGGIASTPVINRPEVAIIGPNRIVERPAYVSDGNGGERIERRKLMNLSISCDHRVVDGWDAASFIQAVKGYLETPLRLLA